MSKFDRIAIEQNGLECFIDAERGKVPLPAFCTVVLNDTAEVFTAAGVFPVQPGTAAVIGSFDAGLYRYCNVPLAEIRRLVVSRLVTVTRVRGGEAMKLGPGEEERKAAQ